METVAYADFARLEMRVHDFLIGFDRDIGALDVVMIHQGRLHFRGDGAVIHEITDFIHRAIDFLPCAFIGSLRVVFRVGRAAPPILRTTVTSVPALPDVVSDSGYVAQCAECNAC